MDGKIQDMGTATLAEIEQMNARAAAFNATVTEQQAARVKALFAGKTFKLPTDEVA